MDTMTEEKRPRRGLRYLLSLTQSELRVLGFLFAMVGAGYEAVFQRAERLGWLAFWASLMGVSTIWNGKEPDPPRPSV